MKFLITLAIIANFAALRAQAAVPSTTTAKTSATMEEELSEESSSSSMGTALAPMQQEVAKLEAAPSKPSILKNVILALDSENVKAVTSQNTAYAGDIEAYQYLKTGYKINDKTSAMVVNTWTQRYGYKEQSAATTFGDVQLRVTRSGLFNIGTMGFSAQGRVYLPTSRASNYQDQGAQIRAYLIGNQEITKRLSWNLMINPRYFVQDNKSFVNEAGKLSNTTDWRLYNSAGLKYALTDALAVETTLGVYSSKSHNSEMAHLQDFSTSAYYTATKNVSLNGGVRSSLRTNIDTEGVELYDHNNMEYYLIASMSL